MSRKIVRTKYNVYEYKFDKLGEVPSEEIEPLKESENLEYIGKAITRVDADEKLTGKAVYTFDKEFPEMLHAKTLRCPHPHAKIKSIDISAAKKIKGVHKIISSNDNIDAEWYGGTSFLFDKELRYEGDEVAFVVADTLRIAEEAINHIKVEYELLPFVIDPLEAIKDSAPKVHSWGNKPEKGGNDTYSRGDIQKGLAEADKIIEEVYTTSVAVHNPTEPHCSVVYWEDDVLTIWDSTQAVFWSRGGMAGNMKMPEDKVRYIKEFMGGGFGSKLEAGKFSAMAGIVSKELNKPIKVSLDRREMNLAVGNRPDSNQKLKIGVKNDGTMTALSLHQIGSMGAFPGSSQCAWPVKSLYKCENVDVLENGVLINAGKDRPFRAPGHVQGTFALESLLDKAASEIGIDPLDLRIKNLTEKDPMWGSPYTSKFLKEAYEAGAKAIDWYNRDKVKIEDTDEIKRGIGMASQIWWGGGSAPAGAIMTLNTDRTVLVHSGTQDIGTGTYTFIAQIVAEVLEVPIDNVIVKLGDTKTCPYAPGSGGSMTAPSVSPAIYDAAMQLKDKLLSTAAAILDTPKESLKLKKDVISSEDSSKSINVKDIIAKMDKTMLTVTGSRNENPKDYAINTFGAQFADVSVNVLTGQITVNKIVAAHDIGRVLNWKTLENQFHGGIMQGLGFALMEERVMDEYTGKCLTTNIHDYKIPTFAETPDIDVIIVSSADFKISPTGVKGIGEPAIIPTAGAIANAVYHALGVQIKDLPMTPDKVINAIYS